MDATKNQPPNWVCEQRPRERERELPSARSRYRQLMTSACLASSEQSNEQELHGKLQKQRAQKTGRAGDMHDFTPHHHS